MDISWVYPLIGLLGEAGELANKMKKIIRDDNFEISDDQKKAISKESGDIKWYDAEFLFDLNLSMDQSAINNINELQLRQKKNLVHGSGDNRELL